MVFFLPTPKHLSVHVAPAFLCKGDLEARRAVMLGAGSQASVSPSGTSALRGEPPELSPLRAAFALEFSNLETLPGQKPH